MIFPCFFIGTMLSEIHQKLTDALVQTQEFQQVAESLNRWVNATQTSLKKQDAVGVIVRLIQPQIDNLKVHVRERDVE